MNTNPNPFASLLSKSNEAGTAPKAYLNYIVFDRDYNVLDGGFVRITEVAKENGTDVSHELLSKELVIKKPGYVYLYLSNDNVALGGSQVEVYFDDFNVEHTKSPVIASQGYYPFGLTFNSFQQENTEPQLYKFNEKEEQDEINLGWLDYGMRMYQPEIGRFGVNDRFGEKYFDVSLYQYVRNNPVINIDVNGDSIKTVFTNSEGKVLSSVPVEVQEMFNSEFGIKVGYNSKTGMMYYAGD
ncbi:RHS repeat-associated core domain-containing protein [Ohtaekwangia kribbensis]|uniref:RHS repeat-associated core domain-containing protein n=1 Tax=Ohtaekwangia kribbensis TaxID=688913 RepID=A0ABW3K6M1_9BACT